MGRVENNNKKKKYILIIGILVFIIAGLICYLILNRYPNNSKNEVSNESIESGSNVTMETLKISRISEEPSLSSSTSSTENNDTSEAVKKLSTEQRAALIILGAPAGWLFNGYPSQETMNGTVRQMAESETNIIKLTKANRKLASNTSEEDQIFYVMGKEVQGVGGVPTRTYAFGRDNNKIYYYVVDTGVNSTSHTENAISLGEVNIDEIWKAYFDVGDLSEITKIANNIIIE